MDSYERVNSDAGLRAVLKAARSFGVSPRRFLGWEPTRIYAHVYENGLLIRTTEVLESEWDDENRELVIAYAMYEADLCPGCQRPLTETLAGENEGLYVAQGAVRCHCCTAREQSADAYADAPQASALFIPVEKIEDLRGNGSRGQGEGAGGGQGSVTED